MLQHYGVATDFHEKVLIYEVNNATSRCTRRFVGGVIMLEITSNIRPVENKKDGSRIQGSMIVCQV